MQARVDTGGRASGSDDLSVLDVERVGYHMVIWIGVGELAGVLPVGRAAPSFQQASLAQGEGAGANGQDPGTARGGASKSIDGLLGEWLGDRVGGDRDQIGGLQWGQVGVWGEGEPGAAGDGLAFDRAQG